ncbi:MAG: hypothetical protein SHS37scaffold220_7 [Phage 67_12]|nr:MAG: hypothetical protein SHS37scaffold220_7 [Phage 67_12]
MGSQALKTMCLGIAATQGVAGADLANYQGQFEAALSPRGTGLPVPCPFCFALRGTAERLIPLPTVHGRGAVRCGTCKNKIEFDDS